MTVDEDDFRIDQALRISYAAPFASSPSVNLLLLPFAQSGLGMHQQIPPRRHFTTSGRTAHRAQQLKTLIR